MNLIKAPELKRWYTF